MQAVTGSVAQELRTLPKWAIGVIAGAALLTCFLGIGFVVGLASGGSPESVAQRYVEVGWDHDCDAIMELEYQPDESTCSWMSPGITVSVSDAKTVRELRPSDEEWEEEEVPAVAGKAVVVRVEYSIGMLNDSEEVTLAKINGDWKVL